jgi:acetyl esterase/lipase
VGPVPTLIDDTTLPKIEVEFTRDIVYGQGADRALKLDLAKPKGLTRPVPAVVWIHGGAWRGGRKEEFEQLIRDSAQAGYVSVSIDYRLVPNHLFPAQVEDAKCAVRWLRAHAEQLQVDPDRIGVVGASAGAHLAMMLGAMGDDDGLEGEGGSPDTSSQVQAVVSFAGPTNLQAELPEGSRKLVADFLGGTVGEKPEAAAAASPITYVDSGDPPMLLVQGTKDPLVPHAQATEMIEALTEAGVPGRVEFLIGAGHGWPAEHERVMRATFEFLDRHLNP